MCGVYQKIGEAIVKPYADGARMAKQAYEKQNSTTTSVSQNSGNSQMPSSSGNSQMPTYADGQQQQQQVQPASMPRATTGRFSFNTGNFRIGESNMNASDTGLYI